MKIIFRCDPALVDHLLKPIPARQALPDWLRNMPTRAFSELHERQIRSVKQCPPFVDAMSYGFTVLLPCDIHVKGDEFSWDWDLPAPSIAEHPRSPLSFHVPEQLEGSPFAHEQMSVLKFNSFWTIELEAGWSLFATHPVNREDLPFRLITGLVDADRFNDAGINFPARWVDTDFQGTLAKGTPIAQCFAVPRTPYELVAEPMSAPRAAQYSALTAEVLEATGVYRKRFRVKRPASSDED
jgi:hypothetical protein